MDPLFEDRFLSYTPCWHLCTPGDAVEILFTCDAEFEFAMTAVGVCAAHYPSVKVLTFTWMNNHFHGIFIGNRDDILLFFSELKAMVHRFLKTAHRPVNMRGFTPNLVEIHSMQQLRNAIVYVNRNGYAAHRDCTPFSYRWSAGPAFFNPMISWGQEKYVGGLSSHERRELVHSRTPDIPLSWRVAGGMIIPSSFVDIHLAENAFSGPHQYMFNLFRNVEAFKETAELLGEHISLDDDELYEAARQFSISHYSQGVPKLMTIQQKMEAARSLHYDYGASNRQIRSILKLTDSVLSEMFPSFHTGKGK